MKYVPHQYQQYATQRIIDTPYIALLLEMGLGKTVSTLTAIDLLLNDYFDAGRVLVIAPLRVADDTWAREIENGIIFGTCESRKSWAASRRAEELSGRMPISM
ncbi:hypothetical protein PACILC2_21780 [Paenibacillus cisolokensis]|uniref:SNF2 N-terminal domain-containing protein n=1 Tax=Paenibacillus cisolokensis TaxID=1658519 RepID=A0ABQ4N612_9BACL|nr:hypothetical protein PACILC2_21780 [Paenibacillus cisolokensis]